MLFGKIIWGQAGRLLSQRWRRSTWIKTDIKNCAKDMKEAHKKGEKSKWTASRGCNKTKRVSEKGETREREGVRLLDQHNLLHLTFPGLVWETVCVCVFFPITLSDSAANRYRRRPLPSSVTKHPCLGAVHLTGKQESAGLLRPTIAAKGAGKWVTGFR